MSALIRASSFQTLLIITVSQSRRLKMHRRRAARAAALVLCLLAVICDLPGAWGKEGKNRPMVRLQWRGCRALQALRCLAVAGLIQTSHESHVPPIYLISVHGFSSTMAGLGTIWMRIHARGSPYRKSAQIWRPRPPPRHSRFAWPFTGTPQTRTRGSDLTPRSMCRSPPSGIIGVQSK